MDDIGYIQQEQEEMEVLFTLLSDRYERRSTVITTNLEFSKWEQIFKNPMTTMAAIDRVVPPLGDLGLDGNEELSGRGGGKEYGMAIDEAPLHSGEASDAKQTRGEDLQ